MQEKYLQSLTQNMQVKVAEVISQSEPSLDQHLEEI